MTLKYLAGGTPTSGITWIRLSDNRSVTMPLINISKHDVRDYGCTADNGVGTPAYEEVSVNLQCSCYHTCSYKRYIYIYISY